MVNKNALKVGGKKKEGHLQSTKKEKKMTHTGTHFLRFGSKSKKLNKNNSNNRLKTPESSEPCTSSSNKGENVKEEENRDESATTTKSRAADIRAGEETSGTRESPQERELPPNEEERTTKKDPKEVQQKKEEVAKQPEDGTTKQPPQQDNKQPETTKNQHIVFHQPTARQPVIITSKPKKKTPKRPPTVPPPSSDPNFEESKIVSNHVKDTFFSDVFACAKTINEISSSSQADAADNNTQEAGPKTSQQMQQQQQQEGSTVKASNKNTQKTAGKAKEETGLFSCGRINCIDSDTVSNSLTDELSDKSSSSSLPSDQSGESGANNDANKAQEKTSLNAPETSTTKENKDCGAVTEKTKTESLATPALENTADPLAPSSSSSSQEKENNAASRPPIEFQGSLSDQTEFTTSTSQEDEAFSCGIQTGWDSMLQFFNLTQKQPTLTPSESEVKGEDAASEALSVPSGDTGFDTEMIGATETTEVSNSCSSDESSGTSDEERTMTTVQENALTLYKEETFTTFEPGTASLMKLDTNEGDTFFTADNNDDEENLDDLSALVQSMVDAKRAAAMFQIVDKEESSLILGHRLFSCRDGLCSTRRGTGLPADESTIVMSNLGQSEDESTTMADSATTMTSRSHPQVDAFIQDLFGFRAEFNWTDFFTKGKKSQGLMRLGIEDVFAEAVRNPKDIIDELFGACEVPRELSEIRFGSSSSDDDDHNNERSRSVTPQVKQPVSKPEIKEREKLRQENSLVNNRRGVKGFRLGGRLLGKKLRSTFGFFRQTPVERNDDDAPLAPLQGPLVWADDNYSHAIHNPKDQNSVMQITEEVNETLSSLGDDDPIAQHLHVLYGVLQEVEYVHKRDSSSKSPKSAAIDSATNRSIMERFVEKWKGYKIDHLKKALQNGCYDPTRKSLLDTIASEDEFDGRSYINPKADGAIELTVDPLSKHLELLSEVLDEINYIPRKKKSVLSLFVRRIQEKELKDLKKALQKLRAKEREQIHLFFKTFREFKELGIDTNLIKDKLKKEMKQFKELLNKLKENERRKLYSLFLTFTDVQRGLLPMFYTMAGNSLKNDSATSAGSAVQKSLR